MPKKPTQREIAEHLKLSQGMVNRLIRAGMPDDSLEKAAEWRRKNEPAKRAGRGGGRKPKPKQPSSNLTQVQAPIPIVVKRSNSGDSLQDALNNAIAVADQAFEAYLHAMQHSPSTLSQRISEHNKAMDARLNAETLYRKELERREILVNKHKILEHCRRALDSVLRRIKKLPGEVGPQANPSEPLVAVNVLNRAVAEIMSTGEKSLRELQS